MNQWEAIAANYDEERDEASLPALLVDELALDLVGRSRPTPGRVLDFGAGTGTLSERLLDSGWHVTAYEPNAPMANLCIERFINKSWEVSVVQDERLLAEYGDQDVILCINVFDHVDDVGATLTSFRSLLKPGGRLVLSIPHPFKNHGRWMKTQNDSGRWVYDFYRLDDYLHEGMVERDRENRNGDLIISGVRSHHRTMATYYNAIVDAGFQVGRMYEPAPAVDSDQQFDAYFQQASRIPYFWVLDCIAA